MSSSTSYMTKVIEKIIKSESIDSFYESIHSNKNIILLGRSCNAKSILVDLLVNVMKHRAKVYDTEDLHQFELGKNDIVIECNYYTEENKVPKEPKIYRPHPMKRRSSDDKKIDTFIDNIRSMLNKYDGVKHHKAFHIRKMYRYLLINRNILYHQKLRKFLVAIIQKCDQLIKDHENDPTLESTVKMMRKSKPIFERILRRC